VRGNKCPLALTTNQQIFSGHLIDRLAHRSD
jgi:hypothetical protein